MFRDSGRSTRRRRTIPAAYLSAMSPAPETVREADWVHDVMKSYDL
jgi:hypothetical protein